MKKILLVLLISGLFQSNLISQSLKGKTSLNLGSGISNSHLPIQNEAKRAKVMKYGNVEAYDKNNNLVGSVLTDAFGNYKLDFKDTGTYNIKIMYAGYETIEESVTVTEDLESDFSLDRNELKKERILSDKVYSIASGTPEFFPPETFTKNQYKAQPATIWALGTLLYVIVMGDIPFETTSNIISGKREKVIKNYRGNENMGN